MLFGLIVHSKTPRFCEVQKHILVPPHAWDVGIPVLVHLSRLIPLQPPVIEVSPDGCHPVRPLICLWHWYPAVSARLSWILCIPLRVHFPRRGGGLLSPGCVGWLFQVTIAVHLTHSCCRRLPDDKLIKGYTGAGHLLLHLEDNSEPASTPHSRSQKVQCWRVLKAFSSPVKLHMMCTSVEAVNLAKLERRERCHASHER